MPERDNYPIYNCHVHTFNLNHVHDRFTWGMFPGGRFLRIRFLRKSGILRWLIRRLVVNVNPAIRRLAYFIIHAYNINHNRVKSQKEILSDLKSYYPAKTRFFSLTMDLDFMINGKEQKKSKYNDQLRDFVKIKSTKTNKDIVFPFIHADPRRIEKYPFYLKRLKVYLRNGIFTGIKIYPALGYFPFDKRLKPVYDYALENHIPIITHCSKGPVFFRGRIKWFRGQDYCREGKLYHPMTKKELPGRKPRYFTQHFTDPLNYLCLFDARFIADYWNIQMKEARKYQNLKICLGHYGGSEEWIRYLKNPWSPHRQSPLNTKYWNHTVSRSGIGTRLDNFFFPKPPDRRPSWFSIISDMLRKFPNLFADISFSLAEFDMLPLLKLILLQDDILRQKILFGTDFYMVSIEGAERELSVRLRAFLGEELFKQIAYDNPVRFLH